MLNFCFEFSNSVIYEYGKCVLQIDCIPYNCLFLIQILHSTVSNSKPKLVEMGFYRINLLEQESTWEEKVNCL